MEILFAAAAIVGMPLVAVTLCGHAFGIVLLSRSLHRVGLRGFRGLASQHPLAVSAALVGASALALAAMHGIEAGVWALAYHWRDSTASAAEALLYSVRAITARDAPGLALARSCPAMGALEGADGLLLFGMSTAFLFAVIQEVMVIVARPELASGPREEEPPEWE